MKPCLQRTNLVNIVKFIVIKGEGSYLKSTSCLVRNDSV